MEVIFLCGVPGAGKSTFRKSLPGRPKFEVISYDDYIEALACETGRTYNDAWKDLIGSAQDYVDANMRRYCQEGRNFIVDMTLLTKKSRKKKMDQIKQHAREPVSFSIYYIDVTYDVMMERNNQRMSRGRSIPFNILADMYARREIPQPDEGFDDIYHVEYRFGEISMKHTQGSKSFG